MSDNSIFTWPKTRLSEMVFYSASYTLYVVIFLIDRVIRGEHYYNLAYKDSNRIVGVLLAFGIVTAAV